VSDLLDSAPHLLIAIQLLRWMSTKVGITDFCSSSLLRCLQIVLSCNTGRFCSVYHVIYSSSYASFLVILCCLCVFILCFLPRHLMLPMWLHLMLHLFMCIHPPDTTLPMLFISYMPTPLYSILSFEFCD
jgi:hypothetical protein